jgi:hypothetical protein
LKTIYIQKMVVRKIYCILNIYFADQKVISVLFLLYNKI